MLISSFIWIAHSSKKHLTWKVNALQQTANGVNAWCLTYIPPHPTRLTHIPKEEKECQYHQGFIKWQTENMKMNINLHLQIPLQFFTIQSKHWNCVFSPSKGSVSSCALSPSKGKHWKMRCLQPILQMPTPSLKAWSQPSTEINVSWNICSKIFLRKHLTLMPSKY